MFYSSDLSIDIIIKIPLQGVFAHKMVQDIALFQFGPRSLHISSRDQCQSKIDDKSLKNLL